MTSRPGYLCVSNRLYHFYLLSPLAPPFNLLTDTGSKPSDIENKVTVSAFARRRFAVVVVRLKMAESVADVSQSFVSDGFGADCRRKRRRRQRRGRKGAQSV